MVVCLYRNLQSPMYVFMSNLALSDIMFTTNVVPNMLCIIARGKQAISLNACIAQFYFYGVLGSMECFLLTVMSYDRYLAVCKPLHYSQIMDIKLQKCLITASWFTSLSVTVLPAVLMHELHFCGPNIIDHFFCDLAPVLELSCSDTSIVKTETFISSLHVVLLPFLFIISSYIRILITIIKIPSAQGRQKTFSTCSAHLLVVCTYFLTIITVYSNPSQTYSSNVNKVRSVLYIVLTPLLNPLIYALRNKEIKHALQKNLFNALHK
ncbi:PREDICTED: olfactory receptor 11L1-like [Nanorana parkeri]|uniref:olfactory receptor 11L1-like n=1 Tax=Nanorana parkeri TaxID=125878 RepID=UPI00085505D1|nr:PREDICTED: olfactory receptor 11L1-like [Nanorana parkeri]